MEHYKINITEEQRSNLKKLADYLLSGNLRAEFDMSTFSIEEEIIEAVNCGTVGCAVGHGPYAGVPKLGHEDWFEYSERVYGADSCKSLYRWCFDPYWDGIDNTAIGAGKRIEYVLKHGIPSSCNQQLYGTEPLCY